MSLCTTYSETEYPGSRCPVHFVIPENGYAVAPVVGISVGSPWDKPFFTKASVTGVTDNPGLIFVEKSSPVFRKRQVLDVPLFSVANKISYDNVEFSPLKDALDAANMRDSGKILIWCSF